MREAPGRGPWKIFGIGLNKTGTRSLADALRVLGFRTLHKGDQVTSGLVDRAATEGLPLLRHIGERFDAYLDVDAIVTRFVELDAQYPGSRFILTTRELPGWLDSRERHVLANQRRASAGRYSGSWLTVDREGWTEQWHRHHAVVRSHFEGRQDALLELDIVGGDGWERLAPFLGRAIPRTPFPWQNREGLGTYRREPVRARLARRLRSRRGP